MVISGLYIETVPGKAEYVAQELVKKKGVEVHHIEKDYKVVLTMELETLDLCYRTADTFKDIDGVLITCLAYTNFEEDAYSYHENDFQ